MPPIEEPAAMARMLRWVGRLRKLQRMSVHGAERIPQGPVLLVANHTGWSGLDLAFLGHVVMVDLARPFLTAVHPSFFRTRGVRELADHLGFFEARVSTAITALDGGGTVAIFPEGAAGNFKPLWQHYQLQPFQPGFARIALASLRPVVPVTIIGGEDASPVLGHLRSRNGTPIPIPLTPFPLPARWRLTFHEAIDPSDYLDTDQVDGEPVEALRADVEALMRRRVAEDLRARGHPFWG